MNRTFLILMMGVFLVGLMGVGSATEFCDASLPPAKQGDTIQLTQTCSNCSYVNLTKIVYPNQTFALIGEYSMTQNGINYNYSFSKTQTVGNYYYTTKGDLDGTTAIQNVCFEITKTGELLDISQGIVLIAQLGIVGLFFGFGRVFQKKWKLALAFDVLAMFIGLLVLNSIRLIAVQSSNLGSMATVGYIIGIAMTSFLILYLFIYHMISVFKHFKDKRNMKWNISDQPY